MENTTSNTNNFLNWVEIKNFKSIKDLRLDCKRVNVFIGKPNVGKSNILEGLGLLGADYRTNETELNDFVRYNSLSNLFYDDDVVSAVNIKTDKISAEIGYNSPSNFFYFYAGREKWNNEVRQVISRSNNIFSGEEGSIGDDVLAFIAKISMRVKNNNPREDKYQNIEILRFGGSSGNKLSYGYSSPISDNPIKRYEFNGVSNISDIGQNYLLPPYGRNLFNVIDHNEEIRKDLAEVFRPNGLNLVLSKKDRKFSVQKQIDGYVYDYPYSNIADTFQRYAFYLAAIESNANSVIVLEEPEVHSFPPYTQELTYRMINSEENQFFVTTHSPYLLQTLIENLTDDQLNVYVTYYENYETKVRVLTYNELREVMDFGIDIFYNLEKYQPNA
ncbi:AAA family ATPase [Spirosoma jeollabukense]